MGRGRENQATVSAVTSCGKTEEMMHTRGSKDRPHSRTRVRQEREHL